MSESESERILMCVRVCACSCERVRAWARVRLGSRLPSNGLARRTLSLRVASQGTARNKRKRRRAKSREATKSCGSLSSVYLHAGGHSFVELPRVQHRVRVVAHNPHTAHARAVGKGGEGKSGRLGVQETGGTSKKLSCARASTCGRHDAR